MNPEGRCRNSSSMFENGGLYQERTKVRRQRMTTIAYCVKCKTKREMQNPRAITMKNGRKAMTGICPVCGTKLFRIGG